MLNEQQQQAVTSSDRFIFVLAGAGSGKTRVIIERIQRLINDGIDPEKILAITFTHKASEEMKTRLGNDQLVHVHTFHQFCYVQLEKLTGQGLHMISENELTRFRDEEILAIANYKNGLMKGKRPHCFTRYQSLLSQMGLVDFDDLLLHVYQKLNRHQLSFSYRYIFIDEFQDTNQLQYALLKKMIHKDTSVFAVGDPDQSIYKFRGASSKIIETYIKEFDAKTYILSINYRSDQQIIIAANRLIKRNMRSLKKDLVSFSQELGRVYHLRFIHEKSEVFWIIQWIKQEQQRGIRLNDIAILYRNHVRAYLLKVQLYEEGIAFDEEAMDLIDAIHMLSIHQAKGLEFDHVIMIGLEENTLPSRRNNQHTSLEEERRLMFVGLTRARHTLILTSRMRDQSMRKSSISRFVKECGMKSIRENHISDIISLGDDHGD